MKRITELEPVDFMKYCLSLGEVDSTNQNNYQHTHDRVHYNLETGELSAEEVCINEHGSCYGRGVYRNVTIFKDWAQFLPKELTSSPFWGDF